MDLERIEKTAYLALLGVCVLLVPLAPLLVWGSWELDRRAVERDATAQANAWSQVPVCPHCGKSPVPPVMAVQSTGAEGR